MLKYCTTVSKIDRIVLNFIILVYSEDWIPVGKWTSGIFSSVVSSVSNPIKLEV